MIRLNVGLNRKVGEPNYGSRGASIHLDVELASGDLEDTRQLRARIRGLYDLARTAVAEELNGGHQDSEGHNDRRNHPRGQSARPAGRNGNGQRQQAGMTGSQRKAIHAIANRLGVDAALEIRDEFGLDLDRLSVREASQAIDFLKGLQTAGSNGGGR
ncbi:MAG: hypothetical protein ACLFVU_15020 [Phycisphaerae bacterium]